VTPLLARDEKFFSRDDPLLARDEKFFSRGDPAPRP
jgi:hypothetical protein